MNNSNRQTSKDTLFKGGIDKLRKAKHRTVQKTVSSKHEYSVNRTNRTNNSDWRAVSKRTPPSCNEGKPNKDTNHDDGV